MTEQIEYKLDISTDGIVRLIEGILLNVLDRISISAKWYNRVVTPSMVRKKLQNIKDMSEWLTTDNCSIWLNIYCKETGRNERQIRYNFLRIIKQSLEYIDSLDIDVTEHPLDK